MTRTIVHVDMDAFYAAVEQLRRPELRGSPVIVGGAGSRGVVAAASYEARAFGVRSAMPSVRAQRLCPHAVFVPGDHRHYAEVSGRIMDVFGSITPVVEPLSLDEAFLDVSGAWRLHGEGSTIAAMIRARVLEQEHLHCSVGVAPNKFLAKLATEHAKPKASVRGPVPGAGVVEVAAGDELAFLRPLPVQELWGVGPKTLERLHRIGVRTIGELERVPLDTLTRAVGDAHGRHLHALAHGRDERPVVPDAKPKSIGHEETFPEDVFDRDRLHVQLVRMVDAVAERARKHGTSARTVTIKVRFADFATITRSVSAPSPIDTEPAILDAASTLLDQVDIGAGVRLLGVTLSSLVEGANEQLSLDVLAGSTATDPRPTDRRGNAAGSRDWRAVTAAVDAVRERFGTAAVRPATLLGDPNRASRPGERPWGPVAPPPEPDADPPR